jgi:hypothetical protein
VIYETTTTLRTLADEWHDLNDALKEGREKLSDADKRTADALIRRIEAHTAGCRSDADLIVRGVRTTDNALTLATDALSDSRDFLSRDARPTFERIFGAGRGADSPLVGQARERFDRIDVFISRELGDLDAGSSTSSTAYKLGRIGGSVDDNLGGIRGSVADLAAYPVLTSETAPLASPGTDGRGGGTALQRSVDTAIRETLGRLPKYTDSKAFVAALNQSFEVAYTAGRSVVTWRPRSSAGLSDLGGTVTGFQASLYARARDARAAVEPILAGLKPLIPDADEEEMNAARGIVSAEVSALVEELGVEGGPRVARVEQLFHLLLEEEVIGINNRPVDGMVGYLADVFGLDASKVNTIDEEQNFSSFVLLQDYVKATRHSWDNFRDSYLGSDLGTTLVLLSRALQVVAESVDEVEAALDSVFVGPAERGVAGFDTNSKGRGDMLVGDLLSWISSFSATEAPALVQEGGRRGCGPIVVTANTLGALVQDLLNTIAGSKPLPDGMRHPRVRHPLKELQTYLGNVSDLAEQVRKAPTASTN